MKFFIDFFPLLAFFVIYYLTKAEYDIYPAVAVLMIASFIQTIATRLLTGKFEKLHLWLLAITMVMGGMTLFFHDDAFIKWKASVAIWLMGSVFLVRQFVLKKILLEEMLGAVQDQPIKAPRHIWAQLNIMWGLIYLSFGFINLYVAFNYSQETWVNFKVWGLMALNLIMLVITMIRLLPWFPDEEKQENNTDLINEDAE